MFYRRDVSIKVWMSDLLKSGEMWEYRAQILRGDSLHQGIGGLLSPASLTWPCHLPGPCSTVYGADGLFSELPRWIISSSLRNI